MCRAIGWLAITEADIENYSGMYLRKAPEFASRTVRADLSPHDDRAGNIDPSYAVETTTPFKSPWRVLMIADEPAKLIESNIVLNLNPPSKIADTSWIKAGKSAWDWWSGEAAPSLKVKPGMNTATMKHYIDFASASGFPYMLIDAGWEARRPDFVGCCAAAGGYYADFAEYRHAGAAALREREEREAVAVGALDFGGQIHGPGVSAV